jgi:hypothetical protein
LSPKEEEKEKDNFINKEYSDEFKDLVFAMMSYHFYDRPSIE